MEAPPSTEQTVTPGRVLHLHRGGTSVVVDLDAEPTPAIVHWGEELEDSSPESLASLAVAARPQRVSGGLDRTPRLTLMSTPAGGWLSTPGLEGHRDGGGFSARFEVAGRPGERPPRPPVTVRPGGATCGAAGVAGRTDGPLPPAVDAPEHRRHPLHRAVDAPRVPGAVGCDGTARHHGSPPARADAAAAGLHLRHASPREPSRKAGRRLDAPSRRRTTGLRLRDRPGSRHPRRLERQPPRPRRAGHDRRGVPRRAASSSAPARSSSAPGESTQTPWVIGSWGDGLTELSHRFHGEWRQRPQHPRRPRPVTLNTWEAVYFDHTLEKLTALADAAADVGVERFVLDDGWFTGRRDDTAGLGDWFVDDAVWPHGLHPLVDHVTALGMEFGLWVEPEMVNPDSDLARAHPDWILRGRMSLPPVGASAAGARSRAPGGLRIRRGATARAAGRVPDRLPQVGPQPRPRGSRHRARAASRGCASRPSRSTDCSMSSSRLVPGSRSRAAPPEERGWISASSTARIASGRATASTRSSGSRTSATPPWSSRRSSWECT